LNERNTNNKSDFGSRAFGVRRELKITSKIKIMINRYIRAIAGTFVIISVVLAMYVDQRWLWFTVFVGANLLQSAITKWCLMEDILKKVFKVKS
jgi:hypothetical protein